MKTALLLACLMILSSCASMNHKSDSVEADSMLYISKRAVSSMTACIEEKDREACATADRYFKENPWLRTRVAQVSNLAGMSQYKWDAHKKAIRKNLATIALKNTFFVITKDELN